MDRHPRGPGGGTWPRWPRILALATAGHDVGPIMYERIVCLTEETTETLYLMEEDWRIVGISGFTVRPGSAGIPAIASGHIYEVKSPIILQPGPAALTDGVTEIQRVIEEWASHVQARGG